VVEEIADLLPAGHPVGHGRIGLRIRWGDATATGGDQTVVAAEAIVGSVHRGAEKLAEVRDYRQVIMLLDRHDWWGAFGSEVGFVLAVERMIGLAVPRRATLLRVVLAELTRCSSHLAMLAGALDTAACHETAGMRVADPGAATAARDAIDVVRELFVRATGNRVHPMFCRIGGLAADVESGWLVVVHAALPRVVAAADRAGEALHGLGIGLAELPSADARSMAVTGPVARACGVDVDLRRDEPYLAYDEVFAPSDVVPPGPMPAGSGDAATRWRVLAAEVTAAATVVGRCLDLLSSGPVRARLPRTLRVPQGETFAWTESPQGASGYYLVSTGGPAPYRLKIRAAMFDTAAALALALPGTARADLPLALASLPTMAGDVDR